MSAHFDHQSGNEPEDTITGNGNFLKNLTLVLRYGDLKEKFSSDEIPSLYKYKYQLLSEAAFDELVINRTPGFAYATITPAYNDDFTTVIHIPQVVEASTGRILCSVTPAVPRFGSEFAAAFGLSESMAKNKLEEHFFKSVMNYIAKY